MLHLIAFGIGVVFFITCGLCAVYLVLEAIIPPLYRILVPVFNALQGFMALAILILIFWHLVWTRWYP
jgi:hypothetical protein